MDQFIMAGLIGAIVVIVSYTTIQVIDIIDKYLDNRKYMAVLRLTPGRLYERPNNPPPPPIKLSANETLKRLATNENLKRLQKVSNQSGLTIAKVIAYKSPNRIIVNQCDDINHPSHYTQGDIEVIDYIEDKKLGYRLGNVVKYVSRAGHKDDAIKDLKKARWYLNREIAKREDHDKSRATIN